MIQRIESEACPPRGLLLKFFVRRPSPPEVEVLRHWIAAGAPEVNVPPDVATTEPDRLVTDEDRRHWAFQPPRSKRGATSIDEFILKKLKANGLTFSPAADRDTLIRRAYLDLVGMPPSLAEWKQWRDSGDPDWYVAMVDHLLDSPQALLLCPASALPDHGAARQRPQRTAARPRASRVPARWPTAARRRPHAEFECGAPAGLRAAASGTAPPAGRRAAAPRAGARRR